MVEEVRIFGVSGKVGLYEVCKSILLLACSLQPRPATFSKFSFLHSLASSPLEISFSAELPISSSLSEKKG